MNMRQYFSNFLTLLKIGESGGKATFNGAEIGAAETVTTEIPYSKSGDLATTVGTLPRIIERAGTVVSVRAALGVVGTENTTISVRNGESEVASITFNSLIPSAMILTANVALAVGDKLTVNITESPGIKAKDLSLTILENLT